MGKVNKKVKHMEKLAGDKARLVRREQMLAEIKTHAIDKTVASKLRSVVTSNQKATKKGPKI